MWLVFTFLQENIPVDEVFEQLKCTRDGLSEEEGKRRLEVFGPNKLEEKKAFHYPIPPNFFFGSFQDMIENKSNASKWFNETGRQVPEILGIHVEPTLLGYGDCCYYGHCSRQWRGNLLFTLHILWLVPASPYVENHQQYTLINCYECRVNHLIGKTL